MFEMDIRDSPLDSPPCQSQSMEFVLDRVQCISQWLRIKSDRNDLMDEWMVPFERFVSYVSTSQQNGRA